MLPHFRQGRLRKPAHLEELTFGEYSFTVIVVDTMRLPFTSSLMAYPFHVHGLQRRCLLCRAHC
jgi:hypothetical protein